MLSKIRTYSVDAPSAGKRLDQFLANAMKIARAQVQKIVKSGGVSCIFNEQKADVSSPSYRVRLEEVFAVDVRLLSTQEQKNTLMPYPMPLDIVFEDTDVIVLNKPAGCVVHPGAGTQEPTLVHGLLAYTKGRLSDCGNPIRPGIVHRLDKDTSGLLVVAKTNTAHQNLARQFALHNLLRSYVAFCWGKPSPLSGSIETQIGRHSGNRQKMTVLREGGKHSHTIYTTKQVFARLIASEVHCTLKTGRTHQVRVHMSAIGCPLIGDTLYARKRSGATTDPVLKEILTFPRQALHAVSLGFAHPTTGKNLVFSSSLPKDLARLKQCLIRKASLFLLCVVSACSGPSYRTTRIPTGGWHHATERPYKDRGVLYIPQQHYVYAAEGEATWYGPECQGHPTAMGMRFNMNAVSAAHRTLPLPSVVRVTNLENGRQMRILVNDRGPFRDVRRRIIDISRRGAQLLGYYYKGKAHVRVECLPKASYQMALAYRRKPYPFTKSIRAASTTRYYLRRERASYSAASSMRIDDLIE
ncbi:MAG: RluA family pseudouridine synthase [Holosporales bacterium]|jgi:23S rRNA pseudouridine1911/1915/1917 synthase|nr:RluA family pseudouridine synthase [Holosporales bacterium]